MGSIDELIPSAGTLAQQVAINEQWFFECAILLVLYGVLWLVPRKRKGA